MRIAAMVALAASVSACGILDPRPDPSRFFLLAATAPPGAAAAPDGAAASIGVGPVTLPPYLRRTELVHRNATHEIDPAPFERWGEPLDDMTARVLGENLALLTGAQVVAYPWLAPAPTRQVTVQVVRFEPVERTRVELVAWVRIVRFDDATSTERREQIEVALSSDDGSAVAAAMSQALLELARTIVAGWSPGAEGGG